MPDSGRDLHVDMMHLAAVVEVPPDKRIPMEYLPATAAGRQDRHRIHPTPATHNPSEEIFHGAV